MPLSLVPSFLVYSYVGAITPGPANLCSLTAALQYGRRPAMRQWRGLFAGFTLISLLSVLITWLLGTLLNDYVAYLSWIGAAYLLWLAWHMVRSAGTVAQEGDPSYPSFRRGFLIQVTNVKGMVLCLTALSRYVLPYDRSFWSLLAVGLFLPLTGPVANLVWIFAGVTLQRLFSQHRRAVDLAMAAALAVCAVTLILPH